MDAVAFLCERAVALRFAASAQTNHLLINRNIHAPFTDISHLIISASCINDLATLALNSISKRLNHIK